jgi:hypothetical protein
MKEVFQTALVILGSISCGGSIVAALSSWLGKVWADRLMAKETAKYREKLEGVVKQLERKNYVSKIRFDAEFSIYRELCALFDEMERTVFWLFPTGIDHLPDDKDAQKEIFEKRYKQAGTALFNASQSLSKNSAFIPKEIYELFLEVNNLCRIQVNLYPYSLRSGLQKLDIKHENECWERTITIDESYKKLQEKLREYLKALDVLEF